ncbi:shikimate dehydrogenase [Gryllotalpicola sp.]|uniref:shikimate dehydrogenase n=1 Tax=Gryllotalpicola sp. TaxID=1932787 RepID=UPI0026373C14|nr:shikimate dehydrogenase [Gryllotalpicola sp.]
MSIIQLAVLGSPIAHSKSPALHQAAYAALGLPWAYGSADVTAAELPAYVDARDESWRGLSLTMPLKQVVLPMLDSVDRVASLTGGANTVRFDWTDGVRSLSGYNTDVGGMVRALHEAGVGSVRHVHLLGGGATAASAIVAAAELGAESALVSVREPSRAARLVALGDAVGVVVRVAAFDAPRSDADTQLVMSVLPGSVEAPIAFDGEFMSRVPLFDVAYDPWPTTRASVWEASGGTVVSGLPLLLHQALLQVRIFVGGDPFTALEHEDEVLSAMKSAAGSAP